MRRELRISEEWRMLEEWPLDAVPASPNDLPSSTRPAVSSANQDTACRAWFHSLELAPDWDAAEAELYFEAPSRPIEVWMNGKRAGGSTHAFVPVELTVTNLLKPGINLIAVRFLDDQLPRDRTIASAWQGNIDPRLFTPPALFGDCLLRGFPKYRIEQVRVWPDSRRKQAEITVRTNAPGHIHIQVEGLPVHHEEEAEALQVTIDLPGAELWSTTVPHCYAAVIDYIASDGTTDRVRVPFALREFTIKEDQFHANARPCEVRGIWHAPAHAASRESSELSRNLIEQLRTARLNALRLLWIDEALLSHADELGFLVFLQLPPGLDADGASALVTALQHHPSLVAYWASAGTDASAVLSDLWQHDVSRLTLVSEMEPGEGPRYYRPRKQISEPIQAFTFMAAPPFEAELESYWRRIGAPGHLVIVEAMSAFGLEAEPASLPSELEGLVESTADLFTQSQSLQCEAIRYPIDAFRLNPRIAGYWMRGLMPFGAWPDSALTDAAGQPRQALRILEALQRPLRPVIQMEKSTLCVREEVHVSVSLLNDLRIDGRAEVFLQVIGPTNQVLWKKRRQLRIPRHGKELWSGSVAASGSTGKHRFVVRLMQEEKVLGDSVFEFHVMEALPEQEIRIHVVDPRGEWESRLRGIARLDSIMAPVHVLPPSGSSVFAYPDNELMQSLAQVRGGGVLLVFSPPADWNELADQMEGLPRIQIEMLAGAGRLHHPFSRQHPIWEALPARGFLRQPYRETVPAFGLIGHSEEAIAGWYAPDQAEGSAPRHTILDCRYGQGRIVFVCYKMLEHIHEDPLAHRAFINIVRHFARRSVPPRQPLPVEQRTVEWMRVQRRERVRRWLVIGEFPNPNMEGFRQAYPPETELDLAGAYPGWRRVVRWEPWFSTHASGHRMNLESALAPPTQPVPRQDFSVVYAYAEFSFDRRATALFSLRTPNAFRVWLNGRPLVERAEHHERDEQTELVTAEPVIKQGRNTLLIKLAKAPGPIWFQANFEDHRGEFLPLTWWR